MMETKQFTIFDYIEDTTETTQEPVKKTREEIFLDYETFVDKFKAKKTTDDCYTPDEYYKVILDFVGKNLIDLSGKRVRRPFWPGGDYVAEARVYGPDDVVIDNPPFSILSRIVRFYTELDIPFFIFAPGLTLFSGYNPKITYIVTGVSLIYENGAGVNTSFITNMSPGCGVWVCGELFKALAEAAKAYDKSRSRKEVSKVIYPDTVITSALLGKIAKRGVSLRIPSDELHFVRKLDNQSGALFGGGFLLSERAAAERAAAERAAAERVKLSPRELGIIQNLKNREQ